MATVYKDAARQSEAAMQELIEQAFEAGRTMGKYERAKIAELMAATRLPPPGLVASEIPHVKRWQEIPHARAITPRKAASAPKTSKAPTIARGVKKATGPRTKGVKERIVKLIGTNPNVGVTVAEILAQTGFKESSVRATLMSLKKAGIAFSEAPGLWSLTLEGDAKLAGNSGSTMEQPTF